MRKNISKQAFRELRVKLKLIAGREALTLIEKFNESMSLINDFLNDIREKITTVAFRDKMEEIYFFKFEKPEYYAQKIYHVNLFILVNQKPVGTDSMLKVYFLDELDFLSRFFKQHAFYYEYYRSGFTEMDEVLFLRGTLIQSPLFAELPELDPDFTTGGDYLFAKFMAYELLQEYLLEQLRKLELKDQVVLPAMGTAKKWFDWTGEMVNLVELGYALYVSGQLNNNKASLAEIFRWLEECFDVEIGIPANRFREIKRRKRISRTHFTDLLRESLLNYMDGDQTE